MSKTNSDAALLQLYDLIKANNAGSFHSMSAEERRRYFTEHQRKHRASVSAALAEGKVLPTEKNVRDALADAALLILATDGAGADHIRTVLGTVFRQMPGAVLTIENKAKTGRLKPKLIKPGQTS